jgi:superfamily II DNA/RNA helicase
MVHSLASVAVIAATKRCMLLLLPLLLLLLLQALAALGITRPSKIQAASYQSVLEGHHCVIAEQTGSGKTLAYLLPLVQR